MRARLEVYDEYGATFRGILPTTAGSLQFSDELGGGGSLSYEALKSDVDALGAWDAVLKISLEVSPGTWVLGPAYAVRHSYSHPGGYQRYSFTARALLEVWASESILLPEYVVGTMPRGAGHERGIGWMMSAYNPATDALEPWDRCYNTSRTTMPGTGPEGQPWPSGTGAKWISASGSTKELESKYFRSWITISGSASKTVEFYLSSDEAATLWVGGERVIESFEAGETGKRKFETAILVLFPGTYAIGVDTETVISKGGDGVDPIIVAGGVLNSDGDVTSWIVASNEDDWVACRRDNEPPDDIPPGPTPGGVLLYLLSEVKDRNCSGWKTVTTDFTATHDSYGDPWDVIAEGVYSYGSETYWSLFQGWGESDEVDVWLTSDMVLHAAKQQGQVKALTLTNTHLNKFSTNGQDNQRGTWGMAEAYKGWITASKSGQRREHSLEVGTAWSRPIAKRILKASLRDSWQWDGSGSMNPPQPGWIPYVDIKLGDHVGIDYQAIEYAERIIMSWSAKAGEGGLLWDIELGEYNPPVDTS